MRTATVTRLAVPLVSSVALAVELCGCGIFPVAQRATHVIATRVRAALLVVILDARSDQARSEFGDLVVVTARPGERLLVLAANGSSLGTFAPPPPPTMAGPAFPAAPPADATSFQRATYERRLDQARLTMRRDRLLLVRRERLDLNRWAHSVVKTVLPAAASESGRPGVLGSTISQAAADIVDLRQTGLRFGNRDVLAIIGGADLAGSPPHLRSSLAGVTVTIAGVPNPMDDPAWQAALLGARASSTFIMNPGTDDRLPDVVGAWLGGAATSIRFRVLGLQYGPAQYEIQPSAVPSLRELLTLLTVTYPEASATINGYTDDLAVRGGNLALSWRRAKAVLDWLISRGVAAYRLQAIGHGSADAIAPNRPGGQPLNRRVIVIIGPFP